MKIRDRRASQRHRAASRSSRLAVAALAGLLFLLAGCSDGPGILYTLATESPRDNDNLPDELTVNAVVQADGRYYVAAGGMWSRAVGDPNWQAVARPRDELVHGLAASGTTLCAGTDEGLFRVNADADGIAQWGEKPVLGLSKTTEQVLRVFQIPDNQDPATILAITQMKEGEEPVYHVYQSIDGCESFTGVTLPSMEGQEGQGRPFDATYASDTYWVTAGAAVYSGPSLDELTPVPAEDFDPEPSGRNRGLLVSEGWVYVANEDGHIYWKDGGQSWQRSTKKITQPGASDKAVILTGFVRIGDRILVGTQGFGFYEFAAAADPGPITRGPRITSQLYEAHITGFAKFGDTVFAATAGDGLSRLSIKTDNGDFGTWDWE